MTLREWLRATFARPACPAAIRREYRPLVEVAFNTRWGWQWIPQLDYERERTAFLEERGQGCQRGVRLTWGCGFIRILGPLCEWYPNETEQDDHA